MHSPTGSQRLPDAASFTSGIVRRSIGAGNLKSAALSFSVRKSGNHLLDALPSRDLAGIQRDVEIVTMQTHESSLSAGELMRHVHFPIDAVLSIIVTLGGKSVEVGTIGNESFVEADAALGSVTAARSTICQVEGRVGRMPIEVFRERLSSETFARLMRQNAGAALYCTQQYLACNAKHSTLARCARWLLMTRDRAGRKQFTLNRSFLGIMLSVGEKEMQSATDELARTGAVSYSGADLSITDAHLLESTSCECYSACKRAFEESLVARVAI